eukprot:TRINITY_DN6330_c0_g1_i1.p1 TRINITY_DN6330_c0_g1~~TRINITY_DN6330_c0_g1_i1.p1  ORF type:complete len:506 (-),score=111.52 TRINITY_DN6330_c0_g1_i1:26-1543(-)
MRTSDTKKEWKLLGKLAKKDEPTQGPAARYYHRTVCHEDQLYVFGGQLSMVSKYTNDLLRYETELQKWSKENISGDAPAPRCSGAVVLYNSKIYIYGGHGAQIYGDVWAYDIKKKVWSSIKTKGEHPGKRTNIQGVVYQDHMYFFGGNGPNDKETKKDSKTCLYNDMYSLNLKTFEWTKLVTRGHSPSKRRNYGFCLWNDKLVLFGGENSSEYDDSIYLFNIAKNKWTSISAPSEIEQQGREGVVLTPVNEGVLVIGGRRTSQNKERFFFDSIYFHVRGRKTTAAKTNHSGYTKIGKIAGHSLTLAQGKIYLFGGYNQSGWYNCLYVLGDKEPPKESENTKKRKIALLNLDLELLPKLKRKRIQNIAKSLQIPANLKNAEIIPEIKKAIKKQRGEVDDDMEKSDKEEKPNKQKPEDSDSDSDKKKNDNDKKTNSKTVNKKPSLKDSKNKNSAENPKTSKDSKSKDDTRDKHSKDKKTTDDAKVNDKSAAGKDDSKSKKKKNESKP